MSKIRDLVEDRFAASFRGKSPLYGGFPRRADAKRGEKKCRELLSGFRQQMRTLVEAGLWDKTRLPKSRQRCSHYEYARLMYGFDYDSLLRQLVRWSRSRPSLSNSESIIKRHIIEPLLTPPGDIAVWPCFIWQGPEQREDLIDHVFSAVSEVLAAIGLMQGKGEPSGLKIGDRAATIGGKEYPLTEKCWEFLRALNLEPGKWISGKELPAETRWDRVFRRLPPALRSAVESNR
jgi:hypothetical protein